MPETLVEQTMRMDTSIWARNLSSDPFYLAIASKSRHKAATYMQGIVVLTRVKGYLQSHTEPGIWVTLHQLLLQLELTLLRSIIGPYIPNVDRLNIMLPLNVKSS